MTDLTNLTASVQADTDATNSAITLLNSLAAQITAAAGDPVALQSLADSISANASSLAAAVAANTPAAPVA